MSNYRTISILPGDSVTMVAQGRVFAVVSCTADFQVRLGNGSPTTVSVNRILGSSTSPDRFKNITFTNPSVSTNDITFYAGDADIKLDTTIASVTASVTTIVKDSPTYTKGSTAATGATTTFSGSDSGKIRKQIVIFNAEAAGGQNITINPNSGTGVTLTPQSMFTLITNGVIKITIPGGASAAAQILETFYS